MDNNDKPIEGHEYDGIKELDNPLPGWWLATFFGTIIFGFIYWIHYSFTDAPTLTGEYQAELAQIQSKVPQTVPAQALDFSSADLQLGAQVYASKCVACHADKGQGLVGPNLTDNFWIHGKGELADIYEVIDKGIPDKGMPPWGPALKSSELIAVTAYVHAMKGKMVPGKAAQGTEFK